MVCPHGRNQPRYCTACAAARLVADGESEKQERAARRRETKIFKEKVARLPSWVFGGPIPDGVELTPEELVVVQEMIWKQNERDVKKIEAKMRREQAKAWRERARRSRRRAAWRLSR
jgi:hypothetical protein